MTDLRIVEWTDESIPQLLELSRASLGTGGAVSKTAEFWRWKHVENPFGRSYGIYAEDTAAGCAAAMRILLRWQFASDNGVPLHSARAVDTATGADYRRRGIFSHLTRQAVKDLQRQGTQLIFNTPNQKSMPGYLKMGWTHVDRRRIYIRPLRPVRMMRRRLQSTNLPSPDNAEPFFDRTSVMTWSAFAEEYDSEAWDLLRAWEAQRTQSGWRTVRSKAYYAWRYGSHPHVTYYVHALHDSTGPKPSLDGYCILRPNLRHGWQEVVLCDLVSARPSAKTLSRLLRSLVRSVCADYVAAHFAIGSLEHQCVRMAGFLPALGLGMNFAVRPLATVATNATKANAWDLTLGDLEIF